MTNDEINQECITIKNNITAFFMLKWGMCRIDDYPREDGRHAWVVRRVDDAGEPIVGDGEPRFEAVGFVEDRLAVLTDLLEQVAEAV